MIPAGPTLAPAVLHAFSSFVLQLFLSVASTWSRVLHPGALCSMSLKTHYLFVTPPNSSITTLFSSFTTSITPSQLPFVSLADSPSFSLCLPCHTCLSMPSDLPHPCSYSLLEDLLFFSSRPSIMSI